VDKDAITGVDETDASESSTEEQDTEELDEETEGESYDEPETEDEGSGDEEENRIPQNRFSKVVEERNTEREARLAAERERDFYRQFAQPPRQNEPLKDTQVDYAQYMNEDGELDLNAYTRDLTVNIREGLRTELRQEGELERRDQQEWKEATQAYPELAQNDRLANLVKASRTQNIIDGKFSKYIDVADEVFAEFGRVREAGAESVRRSERIQSGAGLADMGAAESRVAKKTLTNADISKMSVSEYQKAVSSGEVERAIRAGTLKGDKVR